MSTGHEDLPHRPTLIVIDTLGRHIAPDTMARLRAAVEEHGAVLHPWPTATDARPHHPLYMGVDVAREPSITAALIVNSTVTRHAQHAVAMLSSGLVLVRRQMTKRQWRRMRGKVAEQRRGG